MMYNRKLAALISAILMVFSVVLGGVNSINRLYRGVTDVFINGESGDGVSVSKDIRKNRDDAKNLVTIAAKYMPSGDAALKNLVEAAAGGKDALPDLAENNALIGESAKAVYDALASYSLSEADAKYRQKLFTSIESRNRTMANDSYNKTANGFNTAIARFPASLWAGLSGKSTAPMFR